MRKFIALLLFCSAGLALAAEKEPSTNISIASQPDGATVWIDHVNRGVTPITIVDLPEGEHLLRLAMDGYGESFATVSLAKGAARTLSIALQRATGLLLLITDPPGAEIKENGISLGLSPLLATTLATGEHRLSLSSPGYQTKEIDIKLEGRLPVRQEVKLVSDSGAISLSSDPVGAEVFLNGISRGKTPCKVDRIPGGQVTVELKAPGFQPYSQAVSLSAGESQEVNIRMVPLPGTLRIVSWPEGGRVYINDEFAGIAPYDAKGLEPGTYRVRVDLEGCDPNARDIAVEKGASLTEEFRLSKNTGRLEIVTAPSNAMILLDGRKKGLTATQKADTTAVSDPFALEDVKEGEHTIEVFRKGYETQRRKVAVARGKTSTLQFRLRQQFIPNYEVTTIRSYYKGVLEYANEEAIRLETTPGVSLTIPMKDVKKHGPLKEAE